MKVKDFYRGKKVLITGDTGFKGSWLALWLSELGADVYGYALAPQNDKTNYSLCTLQNIIQHQDGDIRDKEKFLSYFKKVDPDIAFHLAAQPLVIDSYNDPTYNFDVNVMGTVVFLEALRASNKTKCGIVITTDKVYKNNEWVWGYRETDSLGGKDPYSASKSCAELVTDSYVNSFFKNSHCAVATVRAGNVIGGGDWALNRIVPDYFRAFDEKSELLIRNPNSTRPWQHVLEPLFGYLILGAKLYDNKHLEGAWNFGPIEANHVSVEKLITTLYEITGEVKYTVMENASRPHEAGMLKLDISKSQQFLDWQPQLNLLDMLKYTSEGYLFEINKQNVMNNRINQIYNYSKLQGI